MSMLLRRYHEQAEKPVEVPADKGQADKPAPKPRRNKDSK